jgi:hypothetical protein
MSSPTLAFVDSLTPDSQLNWFESRPSTACFDIPTSVAFYRRTGLWPGANEKKLYYLVATKQLKNDGKVIDYETGRERKAKRGIAIRKYELEALVARKGWV